MSQWVFNKYPLKNQLLFPQDCPFKPILCCAFSAAVPADPEQHLCWEEQHHRVPCPGGHHHLTHERLAKESPLFLTHPPDDAFSYSFFFFISQSAVKLRFAHFLWIIFQQLRHHQLILHSPRCGDRHYSEVCRRADFSDQLKLHYISDDRIMQ